MQARSYLFCGQRLDEWLDLTQRSAVDAVGRIARDQFMNASVDDVVEHIVARHQVAPLELLVEHAAVEDVVERSLRVDDYGREIAVPASTFTTKTPFRGNPKLWDLSPSLSTSDPPTGTIRAHGSDGGDLLFVQTVRSGQTRDLKAERQRHIDSIRQYLQSQREGIEHHNARLPAQVRDEVLQRRNRLMEQSGLLESLGLPLETREGQPTFEPLPIERAIKPLPPCPPGGYKPEPALTDTQYDDIIRLLRHMGRSFEQTPQSVSSLDEEALRDLLLAALNTHYRGQATGEAFRKAGKTDIRIEAGDRSAFVAECKLWKGQAQFTSGLDQLLTYLIFRDAKTSLVVFNKSVADRSKVLAEIRAALEGHRAFKRFEEGKEDGELRVVLRSLADQTRDLRCHVFMFHMPCDKSRPVRQRRVAPKKTKKK